MVAGSTTPSIYYGFYCEESKFYRNLYMSIVWASNMSAMVFLLLPIKFKSYSTASTIRVVSFVLGACGAWFPIIHMRHWRDPDLMYNFDTYPYWLGVTAYLIGVLFFLTKFPERYFKGWFDNFGASHQVHHFCVLLGGSIHLWANVREFHKRQLYPCPEHYSINN
jgi:adiponectin receptor